MSELPYTGTTQRTRMPRAEIPGCALVQDLIPLYLDGEVTHESHVLMADHLQQCERCSGYLAGARTVRQQLLQEQNTIKAAMNSGPTVEQVQQPLADGLGSTLWRILMALTWLGGLAMLFIGGLTNGYREGTQAGLIFGGLALVFAIRGLLMIGTHRSAMWLVLSVLTGLLGGFFLLNTIVYPYSSRANPVFVLTGASMVGVMVWCLWPRQAHSGRTQPLVGANQAMQTAVMSALLVTASVGIAFFGTLMMFGTFGGVGERLIGVFLTVCGSRGALVIAQRRGLFPRWNPHALHGALGLALIALGAVIAMVMLPQAVLMIPVAIGLIIGGVLLARA